MTPCSMLILLVASLQLLQSASQATTTSCSVDCKAGFNNWRAGWSRWKKAYCCKHEGVACPETIATTTAAPHIPICQIGLDNWQATWSDWKKSWCCKHTGVGCPATTTPCQFDCQVALGNWRAAWGRQKKDWCCEHEGIACDRTTVVVTTTPAPPTTPCHYDCKVGLNNWRAGWGHLKKEWCCKHEKLGCDEAMTCRLSCFGKAALPMTLPGAVGSGGGAMLADVSLEQCRKACGATPGCDGVLFTNHTEGVPFKSMCYGKREIHTSRCQPGGHSYVTSIFADSRPWGKCAVFGDPHILAFDRVYGPPVTDTDPGEYHLVKSEQLLIQARFGYTRRFPTASSTVGIAVGGPMLHGHNLVVAYVGPETGYKGFKVFWDGKRILTTYPSRFSSDDGVLTATHDAMDPQEYHREGRHTIGGTEGLLPSYLLQFTGDLNIYILVGPDNCNTIIETRKVPGHQDGFCGNFNCIAEDDSLEALESRGAASPIAPGESLFRHGEPAPAWVMRKVAGPSLEDCDPAVRARAERECGGSESCVFDACASKTDVKAVQDGPPKEGRAAAAAPREAKEACDADCKFEGVTATCKERIIWLVAHQYSKEEKGCDHAQRAVGKQCDICGQCSVEASSCRKHAPELTFFKKFDTVNDQQSESQGGSLGWPAQAASLGAAGLFLGGAGLAAGLLARGRGRRDRTLRIAVAEAEEAMSLIK